MLVENQWEHTISEQSLVTAKLNSGTVSQTLLEVLHSTGRHTGHGGHTIIRTCGSCGHGIVMESNFSAMSEGKTLQVIFFFLHTHTFFLPLSHIFSLPLSRTTLSHTFSLSSP